MSSGTTTDGSPKHANVPFVDDRGARGRRVGHFTLERTLAEGGMAELHFAWDNVLERPVVIKRMRRELAGPAGEARLRIEGYCLAQIRHPDVLTVYHAEAHPALTSYLVAEYVPGQTLAQFLGEHRPIPGAAVGLLLYSLARTLAAVHRERIVHRDVKPQNVLVDSQQPGRIVLIDFNVAKVERLREHLTGPGERVGSPAYMSPEQVRALRSVDGRSDLFSLGILGFQLATGVLPFGPWDEETLALDAEGEEEVLGRILQGVYDQKALVRAGMPAYVCEAIDRCLQVSRKARWQTAVELADFLGEGLRKDGLWPARKELAAYIQAPEAYAAALGQRILGTAARRAREAILLGDQQEASARLQRAAEVMTREEQWLWIGELERELERREAEPRQGEAEKQEKERRTEEPAASEGASAEEREEAGEEPPALPEPPWPPKTPGPPGGGQGPKAPGGGKGPRTQGVTGGHSRRASFGAERTRRAVVRWMVAIAVAIALVMTTVVAVGEWTRGPWAARADGATMRTVAAWTTEAAEAERFRRAIAGMTEVDEVKVYAIEELRAGRRGAFEEMMRILDEEMARTEVRKGLLAALARSGSPRALDWMLEHMKRSPERRSAQRCARVLSVVAEDRFRLGQMSDPRIVPALVRMASGRLAEGTARVWESLQALRKIAFYQKLPEAGPLMIRVLALAREEGSKADSRSVEMAAGVLLSNGGAVAEEELRRELLQLPEDEGTYRGIEKALSDQLSALPDPLSRVDDVIPSDF